MWNMVIPAIGTLLSGALAGRKSGQQANPAQLYAQLFQQQFGQLQQAMMPAMLQLGNMAESRGQALGQDMGGSMGAVGGLSSGVGRAQYSLGQTAGSQLRADAESQMRQALVEMSRQNAMGLLAPQAQYLESQRSGSENFMAWLAQTMAGGQMNTLLGNMFKPSGLNQDQAQGPAQFGIGMNAAQNLLPVMPPGTPGGGFGTVTPFRPKPTSIFSRGRR